MNAGPETDVARLLEAISTAKLLVSYTQPDELLPSHLPVALVHAVHDVPPPCNDEAVVYAERYSQYVGLERTREDSWSLPPRNAQQTLTDFIVTGESLGLARMESMLGSSCDFPGTGLSRPAYLLAAARELHRVGIDVLQDVHVAGRQSVASALAHLPGDGQGVTRRLLTYTARDDWVLADEPVREFVSTAIGVPIVSRRRARDLVRRAAHELAVSPRDLDLRLWRRGSGA